MLAPCKDCQDRSPTCHGKCERYAEYAKYCAELNERRYKSKEYYQPPFIRSRRFINRERFKR